MRIKKSSQVKSSQVKFCTNSNITQNYAKFTINTSLDNCINPYGFEDWMRNFPKEFEQWPLEIL
jgi:hypothetical protein